MKRFTVAVVALSGCILGPACQAIVGIEDRVEAPPLDDASADASTTTEAAPPVETDGSIPDATHEPAPPAGCPTGCLAKAPDGWTGPSAVYDGAAGTKPADCPAGYTQRLLDTHQGLVAAPATCDCGAPNITGRMCTASVSTFGAGCDMGGATKLGTANTNTCFVTNTDVGFSYRVGTPTLVPGTCNYPSQKATPPPASFTKVEVACGQAQPVACSALADACITAPTPDQPYGRMCIHKEGEHPSCPSADYPVRFVAHKGIDDQRACTACTATPAGGACGTSWGNRLKETDCNTAGAGPTDKVANGCYTYNGSGTVIDIRAMAPSAGTCTASGGAPTGVASSIDPVTFCCKE